MDRLSMILTCTTLWKIVDVDVGSEMCAWRYADFDFFCSVLRLKNTFNKYAKRFGWKNERWVSGDGCGTQEWREYRDF